MITTPFWFNDMSVLYNQKYMTEFFPSRNFDMIRKLNSIVRLSILYSIIIFFYKEIKNYYIFLIPIVVMIITYLIYNKRTDLHSDSIMKQSMSDKLDNLVQINDLNTECRIPTKDNPFMNPMIKDFSSDNPEQLKSCPSYNNIGIQKRVDELFNEDLYRDVNDIYSKNNSQRQFYTVPGNKVPNDQGSFAQWLYGTPETCKEGNNIACLSANGRPGGGTGS